MFVVPLPLPPFSRIEKLYMPRIRRYERALVRMHKELENLFAEQDLKVTIKYRVKSLKNLYDKLCRRLSSLPAGTRHIIPTDLMGMRIVCPFLSDIDTAARLIETRFSVTEKEQKGADLGFKEFGYESLHFLIRCPDTIRDKEKLSPDTVIEIQVRTLLQDAWAEVEHRLIYKSEFSPLDEPLKRRLAALNANLTLSDIMFQEIRDYQETLHDQLRQRRHAFWNKLNVLEDSPFSMEEEEKSDRQEGPVPRNNDERLLEALLAHNEGDLERAVEIYSVILENELRRDLRSIVYVHRGMAYFTKDDLAAAERDFSQSIGEDPENSKGYLYLGLVKAVQQEYRAAFDNFDQALIHDPFSQDALLERAKLFHKIGDIVSCSSDCRRILDINPGNKKAQELLEQV
ncbi:(p)ppGpp synthetase [Marispirochaeta aestuarii]|uniref:(p)ppGpp synthetase n=1 Tax=Marispirochaeta aestuarii TaxID=1963862 RepID=UPI0029C6E4B0|nr:(p)ppGpp synthetase [Marispirochaeta aestuarii]